MFENIFTPNPMIWTAMIGAMIALPILIHLINMMRHRRVQWAAMDFLMQAYKKQRNWIWLKQLFLLATRIALLLTALFLFGQVGCNNERLASLLGGTETHHYVLLDDSYSMSDRVAGVSVFERARKTIQVIAARAKNKENQRFTLLRLSRAESVADQPADVVLEQIADINDELIDNSFDESLEERRNQFDVSNLAVGPVAALDIVKQLIAERDGEISNVYLLSDFRANQWANPAEIESQLVQLRAAGATVQMIDCVRNQRPNLGITALVPAGNVRSAGVPLEVEVEVKNFGSQAANKVQVDIETMFYDPFDEASTAPGELRPTLEKLPTVFFEEIKSGATEKQKFTVYFRKPGRHSVTAKLDDDAVATDNQRTLVIEFGQSVPVLLIDGPESNDANFLSLAMSPGGGGKTGLSPQIESREFLRDATEAQLSQFHTVFLLDIEQLDESAVKNLETFTRNGGGLCMFVGPATHIAYYNDQLYRGGEGLFPLPIGSIETLGDNLDDDAQIPDIVPEDHPLFEAFLGVRNSPLNIVTIESFMAPPFEWTAAADKKVTVAASIRGQQNYPLVVEKEFGDGRVMAVLTTAGPKWNNWGRNPTFVVAALRLHEYLSSNHSATQTHLVGEPIELFMSGREYRQDVVFVTPSSDPNIPTLIEKSAIELDEDRDRLEVSLGPSAVGTGNSGETLQQGIYEAWLLQLDGRNDVRRWSVNVDPIEGDLRRLESRSILDKLQRAKPSYVHWDQISANPQRDTRSKFTKWLLLLIVLFLLGEQLIAFSASYHPLKGGAHA